jgi:hypothetical protein
MRRRPQAGLAPPGGLLALALALALARTLLAGDGPAPSQPPRSPSQSPSSSRPQPPATVRHAPSGASITVRSRAAPAPSSEFLRPPGSGRYDTNPPDWRDVPPWRQTSFFGLRAQGQFFVYVVDCSGSMIDDSRLVRAKAELRRSVTNLQLPQRFQVIFYNDEPLPMLGVLPRSADLAAKQQMNQWLRLIEPDGGTDPRGAMAMALSLRPDAVFLLSDGEFPDGTVEAIAAKNPRKVPIHCVDLSGGAAGDQLRRIAADSGGQYAPRPPRADELSP